MSAVGFASAFALARYGGHVAQPTLQLTAQPPGPEARCEARSCDLIVQREIVHYMTVNCTRGAAA